MHAIWTAATGMQAQQMRIDAIANNLANVNTTAYKKSNVEFQDLLYQAVNAPNIDDAGIQIGLGVRPTAVVKDQTEGNMQVTNNSLDLAIDGQGFFQVRQNDAAGTPAYTRDGSFQMNSQGQLVTSTGLLLDPPITIPPGATNITIRENGQVYVQPVGQTQQVPVGQISLFLFPNPSGLAAQGNNLYLPTSASGVALQGQPGSTDGHGLLRQGMLETSNVELVTEMVMMI
ncbi:MAG: flagellar basal-body rod protein FlgG, partial [Cyanobacteria bacterium REEB65]|nr:flagellar basal-body rod protein FlgG [Cyanobacteria bacterium REEB65]